MSLGTVVPLESLTQVELLDLEAQLEAQGRADLQHAAELRAYAAAKREVAASRGCDDFESFGGLAA